MLRTCFDAVFEGEGPPVLGKEIAIDPALCSRTNLDQDGVHLFNTPEPDRYLVSIEWFPTNGPLPSACKSMTFQKLHPFPSFCAPA